MSFNAPQDDEHKKMFSEINITPLTDIFLVLLIIMMVIAPSFKSVDNSISMPKISTGVSIEQKNATVSITKDGTFYVNEDRVSVDNLENSLMALIDNLESKEVIVKADETTKSSEIMKVMKAAQNAGFEKLVVAGEPLNAQQQKDLKDKQKQEKS